MRCSVSGERFGKGTAKTPDPIPDTGESREKAGELLGVGGRSQDGRRKGGKWDYGTVSESEPNGKDLNRLSLTPRG